MYPAIDQTRQETLLGAIPVPLGDAVRVNKADYRLVERTGRVAIYEGPRAGMFEVVVIAIEPAKIIKGIEYPCHERFPSPEDWGTYGWTFTPRSHLDPLKAAQIKKDRLCVGCKISLD